MSNSVYLPSYFEFFKTLSKPSLLLCDNFKILDRNTCFIETFSNFSNCNSFEEIIDSEFTNATNFQKNLVFDDLKYNDKIKYNIWYKDERSNLVPQEIFFNKITIENKNYYSLVFNEIFSENHFNSPIDFYTHYDLLTRLPNRKATAEKINDLLKNNIDFKLCLVDIDGFKFINDYYGQDLGDKILLNLSEVLKKTLTFASYFGRLSSDEFIVVYENGFQSYMEHELNNLKTILKNPVVIEENEISLSISIGVSSFPNFGNNWSTLMSSVDYALTQAKALEGSSIVYYNEEHKLVHLEKLTIINKLKNAIKKEEFELFYQPIYDNKKQLIKVEALIRWRDKNGEFIPPMKFIPIAEESGLISEIGMIVGKKALANLDELKILGFEDIKISINCSLRDFEEKHFKKTSLLDLFLENKEYSKNIILEITEGLFMKEHINYIEQLTELKEAGFEIALDDFGTGYSSLSYLTKLPLDLIKIDKSFILSLNNDASLEIVKIIINMAKILNLEITAEGVEEAWHFDLLKKLSCDCFQGYYLNKPLPFEILKEILLKNPNFN